MFYRSSHDAPYDCTCCILHLAFSSLLGRKFFLVTLTMRMVSVVVATTTAVVFSSSLILISILLLTFLFLSSVVLIKLKLDWQSSFY